VTGPRLLARDADARARLVHAMESLVAGAGLSSAHVNFLEAEEDHAFGAGWLARIDVQYHWRNSGGWGDFDAFLAAMDHKHRKNIRQERAKLARSGIAFRVVHGDEASDADIAAMHGFYLQTFSEYGNTPTLTLAFLRHLAEAMPRQFVLFLAERSGAPIAGAMCLRGSDTLYGRYWGTAGEVARIPGLHFETCYYQGIDYCLREGLVAFEPGAQGEHKLARGFLPALVRSRHWIADPAFSEALGAWCTEETASVLRYKALLDRHSPFRHGEA
jgi:predicted N-acyltransferase